jgi:hypothetical protein
MEAVKRFGALAAGVGFRHFDAARQVNINELHRWISSAC